MDIARVCHEASWLASLRRQSFLTDVEIQTSNSSIEAHKIVLASHSAFFRALFSPDWASTKYNTSSVVDLQHLKHDVILAIIEALYTNTLNVCEDTVINVFAAASELDVQGCRKACSQFMRERMSTENACQYLVAANQYHHEGLKAQASAFIVTRVVVCSDAPLIDAVYMLDFYSFECLLQAQQSTVSELDLFVLVLGWVAHNAHARRSSMARLLSALRPDAELLHLAALAQQSSRMHLSLCDSFPHGTPALHVVLPQAPRRSGDAGDSSALDGSVRSCSSEGDRMESTDRWDGYATAAEDHGRLSTGGSGEEACDYSQTAHPPSHGSPKIAHPKPYANWQEACSAAVDELTRWPHMQPLRRHCAGDSQASSGEAILAHALHALELHQQQLKGRGLLAASRNASGTCINADDCAGVAASSHVLPQTLVPGEPAKVGVAGLGVDGSLRQWGQAESRIVVAGGRDSGWRGLAAVATYDVAADVWEAGPPMLKHMPFARAVAIDQAAYVVGNFVQPQKLLPDEMQWRLLPMHGYMSGLLGMSTAHVGRDLWVLGGRSLPNKVHSATFRYDTVHETWHAGPPLLTARYSTASVSSGSLMFVCGGQDNVSVLDTVEMFDSERGWIAQAPLLTARKYHATACVHRRLYCLGGKDASANRLDNVEAFDAREGRWKVVGHMPEPRSSFGCAQLGCNLYMVGGNDATGNPVDSTDCFCPIMQRWRSCAALPWCCNSLGTCSV